jgi:hypothetical protein
MWHGKCVSKSVRLARGLRPAQGKPLRFRGALNEMSKQFFHKFLLNDTFAPAERFNPKLALGTVGRNVPGALAGAISFG